MSSRLRLGSLGCAKELLSHPWNAETNSVDVEGWTPLMEAGVCVFFPFFPGFLALSHYILLS